MRKNYDFSTAVRNPYARRLKRQLTIRLDEETIDYFQGLSREMSLPYQTLMNMYLRDCAETGKRPHWSVSSTPKRANKPMKRSIRPQGALGVASRRQLGGGLAAERQAVRRI